MGPTRWSPLPPSPAVTGVLISNLSFFFFYNLRSGFFGSCEQSYAVSSAGFISNLSQVDLHENDVAKTDVS